MGEYIVKVSSVSVGHNFGIKLAPNITKKLTQNCVGVSPFDAEKLVAKLAKIKPDNFYLENVSTKLKRNGFLGPKYRYIKVEYETQNADNTTIPHLFGNCEQEKFPYNVQEIFDTIVKLTNKK